MLADPRLVDVDLIVSGGDLVAGPMPSACLDLLSGYGPRVRFIRGNADRNVLERGETHGAAWCADELGPSRLATVAEWPLTIALDVAGGALFCHATPRSDEEIVTRLTPDDELGAVLATRARPSSWRGTPTCRSIGLPGTTASSSPAAWEALRRARGAFWALLGDDVELVQNRLRHRDAAAAIRESAFPDADEHAETLLDPPPPDEVSAYFESLRGA